ncbi:F-box/WD repeat-containing protein 4 isoform X2 [Tachypleus tridentatus]|uniref:F-box/WD repeat-containing protein 4 isoform X2 n=1 Tax=Tachypleus tridentatus TaxID=6853 RepID=UPI003FD5F00D
MTKETQVITFLFLPHDVLCNIMCHCDVKTLGRLSLVCRQLNRLVSEECIWVNRSKTLLVTNQEAQCFRERSFLLLSSKEKYKVSLNWRKSKYKELGLISQRTKYMPWIQLEANKLWYSRGSNIFCYTRKPRGLLQHTPELVLRGHVDDVCHFVCKDGIVYSGSRNGTVCGWHADNGKLLFRSHLSHFSDINSVDVWNNIIVSGSKDGTVKTWNVQKGLLVPRSTLHIRDRVWSLTITPINRFLVTGSAGFNGIPPLQLYDLETGSRISCLGENFRKGAGILHLYTESEHDILSCGYDATIRMWDLRCGNKSILEWEDPYDSAVYCISSDHNMTVLSGTCRHGVVRLWDKRWNKQVQMFYVGRGTYSPVYCVTFDACNMYVALDNCLTLLSFDT